MQAHSFSKALIGKWPFWAVWARAAAVPCGEKLAGQYVSTGENGNGTPLA
jgi:hypothetical protein